MSIIAQNRGVWSNQTMRLKDNSRMQHPRTMLDILLRNEQGAIEEALQPH
ncbi:hypothetical protein [Yoonia sp.]|nr:hypothetical protein [Yoonia sp.]